jgi:AcrR family transcriptional regulator
MATTVHERLPDAIHYAGTVTITRGEQKERTRRAILDAALLLSEESGLSGLSLRQLAKEVGVVPTAFYRHFASIEELGLSLVDESFASLRAMVREVRQGNPPPAEIISRSVTVLAEHVHANRGHFGFITRERYSGPPAVREAVRRQLDLFERELATDLARIFPAPQWSSEDFLVLGNLIVGAMVNTVIDLLEAPQNDAADQVLSDRAEKQLRMIVVGALQWRSEA